MTTTSTPKGLSDLRYCDNVQTVFDLNKVESAANRFFHELFAPIALVHTVRLFTEDNQIVYECYQDSGSDDYLYIIVK